MEEVDRGSYFRPSTSDFVIKVLFKVLPLISKERWCKELWLLFKDDSVVDEKHSAFLSGLRIGFRESLCP